MRTEFTDLIAKHPDEVQEFFYQFGGHAVCMRFVGRELARHIDGPFSHLRSETRTANPRLTIELWDANKTKPGEFSWRSDLEWHEATVRSKDERFIGQQLPHTFSCLDREARHIMSAVTWHERIFIYERAKPLARLLLNWHNDQNLQVIHAGLVARENQGILFAGKSGSGKSTTSLACIIAGLDYLGEDYVGLERGEDNVFTGHSLYNSVFLKTDHLARFPELAPYAIKGRPPQEEKSVVVLSDVFPARLKRAVPIRVLVIPRVVDTSEAQLHPASKGEALLALGPSSLLQIPNRALGICGFNKLAQLVERLPCFRLEVGADFPSIARCVAELVEQVRAS
jgi:hypothetical protein